MDSNASTLPAHPLGANLLAIRVMTDLCLPPDEGVRAALAAIFHSLCLRVACATLPITLASRLRAEEFELRRLIQSYLDGETEPSRFWQAFGEAVAALDGALATGLTAEAWVEEALAQLKVWREQILALPELEAGQARGALAGVGTATCKLLVGRLHVDDFEHELVRARMAIDALVALSADPAPPETT